MTVGEAQGRVNSAEFERWRAWLRLFSPARQVELLLARLCALLSAANGKAASAADFLPNSALREQAGQPPEPPGDHWREMRRRFHER